MKCSNHSTCTYRDILYLVFHPRNDSPGIVKILLHTSAHEVQSMKHTYCKYFILYLSKTMKQVTLRSRAAQLLANEIQPWPSHSKGVRQMGHYPPPQFNHIAADVYFYPSKLPSNKFSIGKIYSTLVSKSNSTENLVPPNVVLKILSLKSSSRCLKCAGSHGAKY